MPVVLPLRLQVNLHCCAPTICPPVSCAHAPGQDNEPLMRALSALINLSAPDLVLFVGEALVGNDTVDPLTHSDPF